MQINHDTLIGPNVDDNGAIVDFDSIPAFLLLNHSSNSNAWFEGDENLVASRDIMEGEEILIDYAIKEANGLTENFESKAENERRKQFLKFDFERLWEEYKGHTHSFVHKMANYIKDTHFGDKDSPYFSLNKKITSQIHPLGFGRGLFAVEEIKKGELIWIEKDEIDDLQIISYEEIEKLEEKERGFVIHYGYQVDNNNMAIPKNIEITDHSYLMNHCCDPNTVFYSAHMIIALRDINPGEELTFDYATSETLYDSLDCCCCGSLDCRKQITKMDYTIPSLKEKYENFWQPFILGLFWKIENGK